MLLQRERLRVDSSLKCIWGRCECDHAPQDVLDWLLANREDSLTPAQIQKRFGYECSEGTQLHKNLLANSKVGVSADGAFTYKVCGRGQFMDSY